MNAYIKSILQKDVISWPDTEECVFYIFVKNLLTFLDCWCINYFWHEIEEYTYFKGCCCLQRIIYALMGLITRFSCMLTFKLKFFAMTIAFLISNDFWLILYLQKGVNCCIPMVTKNLLPFSCGECISFTNEDPIKWNIDKLHLI